MRGHAPGRWYCTKTSEADPAGVTGATSAALRSLALRPVSPYINPMDSYDFGRLIYLLILAVAIGGSLLVRSRRSLGKFLREATTWGLIFVGIVAGYGLWGDIRNDIAPRQTYIQGSGQIEVPQSPDGALLSDPDHRRHASPLCCRHRGLGRGPQPARRGTGRT